MPFRSPSRRTRSRSSLPLPTPHSKPASRLGHILVWSAHLERARAVLRSLHRDWSERDERMAASALWYLAVVELRSGRLSLAEEYAAQAGDLSVLYSRDEAEQPQNLYPLMLVAAHRGDLERARGLAEDLCRLAGINRAVLRTPTAMLAIVEYWSGDAAAAVARFAAGERMVGATDVTSRR